MSARDEELQAAWQRGTRADIKRERPPSSVLSIRLPAELFEELSKKAREEGKPASLVARELIEAGLASGKPKTPVELAKAFSRWVNEELGRTADG